MVIFIAACALILQQTTGHMAIAAILFCSGFVRALMYLMYLPDLPHAAGTAVLLLLILRRKYAWSVLLVLILMLIRESTMLLSVILIVLTWRRQRRFSLAVASMTIAALFLTKLASRQSLPNIHGISEPLYLLLKIPFNIAKNLVGCVFTTDTIVRFQAGSAAPPSTPIHLPSWLPLGQLHELDFVGWSATGPLTTFATWLTQFGIAPTLLVFELRAGRRDLLARIPLPITLAMCYGLCAFLIGPALGAWTVRLTAYGWPILLAAPALCVAMRHLDRASVVRLLLLQLVTCSLSILPDLLGESDRVFVATLLLAVPFHVSVIACYRKLPTRHMESSPDLEHAPFGAVSASPSL